MWSRITGNEGRHRQGPIAKNPQLRKMPRLGRIRSRNTSSNVVISPRGQADIKSPISRHPVSSRFQYVVYVLHDASSLAVLTLVPLSMMSGVYSAIAIPLVASVLSGWLLVGYRVDKNTAKGHLTRTQVVTSCIVNQGLAVMLLGWLLFSSPTGNELLTVLSAAIALHAVYCTAKCFRIYLSESRTSSAGRFSESTLQLMYLISAPNAVLFFAFSLGLVPANDRTILSIWLLFECLPGMLFSIAHDKKWLWYPNGLSRCRRHAVCLLCYVWPCVAYYLV